MTSLVGDTDGAPLSIEMSWAGKSSVGMIVDGDKMPAMGSSPCDRRLTRGVTVVVDDSNR